MKCDYCGENAEKVSGKEIYPHRPDLFHKVFYRCEPCDAYVGCHPGGDKSLGRLANMELRSAKRRAHGSFDHIWRNGDMTRKAAYKALSEHMGIPVAECHIGMFDIEQCKQVMSWNG